MSATPAELAAAQALVASALSLAPDHVGAETRMYDLAAWDSFGQLSVILAVEAALGSQIADRALFESLTSVPGIAALLAAQDDR